MPITRRGLLLGVPAVGALTALAGYGRAGAARASAPGPSGQLELYSWWTEGADQNGLLALLADFKGRAPLLACYNGARSSRAAAGPQAELERRLAAGDPPDSFQCHAGAELAGRAAAGRLAPLDQLYRQQGWAERFPAELLPRLRGEDGGYYGVPVGIHRTNMLWSNPAVLSRAGADPAPRTVAELLDSARRVARSGPVGLAVGGSWSCRHLWETVLLAGVGPQGWDALWRGTGWDSAAVAAALRDLRDLLALSNPADRSMTGWEDATALVASGQAGYQVMGDWAEAYLRGTLALRPRVGYDWAAAPGTDGVFQYMSDTFTLAAGARHREAALAWLAECGSLDGQLAFNGAKGAIPARTDLPPQALALFGPYARWSLDQWRDGVAVGSLTHGVVASAAWGARIDAALTVFLADRDVPRFQDALVRAAGG
ncbi:ABC transporter substrate-binding protein [Kitasatospora sp. MBT63]|uniref:ABC transporter substrate-binding protein n=1 Tax=Kitasatospora sp. MBT63 TaxID=1444768 RepID=UPI00069206B0|nr:ABC transporter substrate-binding protein [Kitasatospora sp. MBT63]